LDSFTHDLRYTLRKLARAPLFTTVAVLTLAVGIGSNAAIFSVVNGVLLKPLPFEDPETLVGIWHTAPGLGFPEVNQSPALHFTYAAESRTFESVGMWDNGSASVTGLDEPAQVEIMQVTHQTLPMLGIRPSLGRTFTPDEDTPEGPQTALLGHGYWQERFGGDPDVLGRTVTVNGVSREIIGVMPDGFRFLRYDPAIYLPFRFDEANVMMGNFSYQAMGRLLPDVSVAQANADVERMVPFATERYPGGLTLGMLQEAQFGGLVRPLKQDVVGDVGSVLWVLLGTVAIVLLIACANVANLFIVRAEGRQREIAVRTAMGAGRGKITGQLLLESLVLGAVGGLAGLALAFGGLRFLIALGPESLPRLHEIGLDPLVLLFTLVVSLLAGVFFGLVPALQYGRPNLASSLREGGRGGSAGKERHLARNALVVAQMSLALVLLAGSGLMIRSFQALRSVDPGFDDPEQVLYFRVAIPSAEVEDPSQVALTHQEILQRVQAIPGVASAALSSSVTMDGWDSNDAVNVEEFPVEGDQLPPIRRFKFVGEGYFSTMGNPILAGRDITWADIDDRAPIAVVTANFVSDYWATPAEAIGKRISVFSGAGGGGGGQVWREIVGVVGDVHDDGMSSDPVATVFWPQVAADWWDEEVFTQRSMAYAVRVEAGDPNALQPQVRDAVWSVNPNLPLARVTTLDQFVGESMARTSFTLVMLGIAAAVALFLGSVGVYGVISYVVAQRTREIGVRIALGAEQADVRRMVLKQGGSLAAAGVVVGLVVASFLTRLMSSLLYGVSPIDVPTFGAVAVALSAIALLASWVPARRASSVDPVTALRFE
jgi:putative ABC transport system permease protein